MKYGAIPSNPLEWLALRMGKVPVPLLDSLFSILKTRSIMAGVRLGVFEALRERPLAASEVAAACRLDEECTESLLRFLVGVDYLEQRGRRFALNDLSRRTMVAGATGTGKTKPLQLIAEQLSAAGVAVLMADVKGDLSGLARPGEGNDRTAARAKDTWDNWEPAGFQVEFLSLGTGGLGVPVRATVDSFGSVLLSKVLGLNATQESTLGLIFHWAKQAGRPPRDRG